MRFLLCLMLVCCTVSAVGQADEIAEVGRALLAKHGGALVTLRVTLQASYSEPGMATEQEEMPTEAPATVVDPSGLAVTSLALIDPSYMMGETEGDEDFQYDIKVLDARMLTGDGKEIPVRLALRDEDLDLAVFKPEQTPVEPMACVDLAAAGAAETLDSVVLLSRLGRTGNRTTGAALARVNAVVSKPRLLYVLAQGEAFMGAPAFTAKGEPLGIVALRWLDMPADETVGMNFGMGPDLTIVQPAADVLSVVSQAREERTEEPAAP